MAFFGKKWPEKTLMVLILFNVPGVLHFVVCEGEGGGTGEGII